MNLKHLAYRALSRGRRLSGQRSTAGLRVLMYHSVGGRFDDPYGTSIDPTLFAEHASMLAACELTLSPFGAGTSSPALAVTFDDGYRDTLTTAAPALVARHIPFTAFVTSGFVGSGPLYLSETELKELAAAPGASIGAHGARHVPLTSLSDAALVEELSSSRKTLEDWIGKPVVALSYPHGTVDRRVRDAAQAAGYLLGGCSRYGVNGAARDPLLLCRTEVTRWDTPFDLSLKLDGSWDWFALRHPDPAK